MIYLDYAATSFPKAEAVCRQLDRLNRTMAVNAGRGTYRLGRMGSGLIEETRCAVAALVDWEDADDVYFTASATQAMNQILQGLPWETGDVVYISAYEHNAVVRTLEGLRGRYDLQVEVLPMDETGRIDLETVSYQFSVKPPQVVCLTMVSNVTGYLLPVEEVAELAAEYQALVVVDGAQGLGTVPFSLQKTAVDFLVFAGHKALGGPFGVGGFISGGSVFPKPVLFGGTGSDSLNLSMPGQGAERYEVGSQNIVAIGGLGKALELLPAPEGTLALEQRLIQYLYKKLDAIEGIRIFQPPVIPAEFAGVLSLAVEGYRAGEVGQILDEEFDIAVRTGYHCAPLVHSVIDSSRSGGTVRVSVGRATTEQELDSLAEALADLASG